MKLLATLFGISFAITASATVVYSTAFESDAGGFGFGGSLTSLSRVTLPTDSTGPASLNTSTWLGRIGSGVAKSPATSEIVTLDLAGLPA